MSSLQEQQHEVIDVDAVAMDEIVRCHWKDIQKETKTREFKEFQQLWADKVVKVLDEYKAPNPDHEAPLAGVAPPLPAAEAASRQPLQQHESLVPWKKTRRSRGPTGGRTVSVKWYETKRMVDRESVHCTPLRTGPLLPEHNSCIPIRNTYNVEDQNVLEFVPYDDDIAENGGEEDSVYEERFVLFDTKERENMLQFGMKFEIDATNRQIDETIRRCLDGNGDEDEGSALDEREINLALEGLSLLVKNEYWTPERLRERYDMALKDLEAKPEALSAGTVAAEPTKDHDARYLHGKDSYRNLFCRRCYVYCCNLHSILDKPSLQLQYELGIQAERERLPVSAAAATTREEDESKDQQGDPFGDMVELSEFHKTMCKRMFLIFDGDISQMAMCMRASRRLVEEYVRAEQFNVPALEMVKPCKKSTQSYFSVKQYKPAWYNAINAATFHPFCIPCSHDEECSDDNCTCVKRELFCTLACSWRGKSRNFFRGCDCRGACTGPQCTCVASKRECDPDLCKRCQTCTDPAGKLVTTQSCRNDSINMQRQRPVLIAKSQVAGFGLYTRDALEKGGTSPMLICQR